MKLPKVSQYPKEVLVAGEPYRVKFVPRMSWKTNKGGYRVLYGVCDPESKEIRISKGIGKTKSFETFIHEVIHAFEFEYELDIKHSMVYNLEQCLFNFFVENF